MSSEPNPGQQAWLERYLSAHGGIAGTVHIYDAASDLLVLSAWLNIPPPVVNITRTIPKGKGMAGLAWERSVPVQTCNLQQTTSPDVRPGAKAVNAQAAVAIPVASAEGALRAVVGIAFLGEREIEAEEMNRLTSAAAELP
jgi:L-methionine (R)-S-oxide reductase